MPLIKALGKFAGPLYLCLVALTYSMGVGVSRYLGFPVRVHLLVLGLIVALLIQLAMDWLGAAFRWFTESLVPGESRGERARLRATLVGGAVGALAIAAILLLGIMLFDQPPIAVWLWVGLSLIGMVLYSLPPMRVIDRGFGELLLAVQVAYITPLIGFLLQAGAYHLLLNVCAVALTLLMIASLVVLELPSYAEDTRRGRSTLPTRMGWERALTAHHGLMGAAYLILGASIVFTFSFRLLGPALLTLPFAILQVLLLRAMAAGAKPIWNLLRVNAVAIFALTAYFLALSFWLR